MSTKNAKRVEHLWALAKGVYPNNSEKAEQFYEKLLESVHDQATSEELFNELAAEFRDCRDELAEAVDEVFFSPFRGLIVGVCELLDELAEPGDAWNWSEETAHDAYRRSLRNKYMSIGFTKAEAFRIMDTPQVKDVVDAYLTAGGVELSQADKAQFVTTVRSTLFK